MKKLPFSTAFIFIVISPIKAISRYKTIEEQVTEKKGDPIPGTSVSIKPSTFFFENFI